MAAKKQKPSHVRPPAIDRAGNAKWEEVPEPARAQGDALDLAPGEEITVTIVERCEVQTRFGERGLYACTLSDGEDTPCVIWESAGLRHLAKLVGETVRIVRIEDTVNGSKARKTYKVYRQR